MTKKFNLVTVKSIQHIGNGMCWIAYGVLSIFNNDICSALSHIFLLMAVAFNFAGLFPTSDTEDEMSMHNMQKAKAQAIGYFRHILCIVLLIIALLGVTQKLWPSINDFHIVSLQLVISLLSGSLEILIGALFRKYEKDGE